MTDAVFMDIAGILRQLPHLLRHRLRIVAVAVRAEHRAAARPVRRARRALAGAAGPLLLPRLLVTAGDFTARLGLGRALATVGEERLHRLVHDRHVDDPVERALGELARAALLPLRRVHRRLEGLGFRHHDQPCFRTKTMPLVGPATLPRR